MWFPSDNCNIFLIWTVNPVHSHCATGFIFQILVYSSIAYLLSLYIYYNLTTTAYAIRFFSTTPEENHASFSCLFFHSCFFSFSFSGNHQTLPVLILLLLSYIYIKCHITSAMTTQVLYHFNIYSCFYQACCKRMSE